MRHQVGIELRSGALYQFFKRLYAGAMAWMVGARMGHDIVSISNGDQASAERNGETLQAAWIAFAIPAFMMMKDGKRGLLELPVLQEQPGSSITMLLNLLKFLVAQRSIFMQ